MRPDPRARLRVVDSGEAPASDQATAFLPPLLQPGRCVIQSIDADVRVMFESQRRVLLLFCEVLEPREHDGVRLTWFAPLPTKRRDRPSPASKFLRAWILVMGRRPARGEYLAHQVLLGKRFEAIVGTVEHSWERDEQRRPVKLPPAAQYSVIRSLVAMA
jgi:hypothetical protein